MYLCYTGSNTSSLSGRAIARQCSERRRASAWRRSSSRSTGKPRTLDPSRKPTPCARNSRQQWQGGGVPRRAPVTPPLSPTGMSRCARAPSLGSTLSFVPTSRTGPLSTGAGPAVRAPGGSSRPALVTRVGARRRLREDPGLASLFPTVRGQLLLWGWLAVACRIGLVWNSLE